MASTATPLRTVPTTTPSVGSGAPARSTVRSRGNHPAGRALAARAAAVEGGSLAPVVPLRPVVAEVVALRPAAPGGPVRLTRRGRVVLGGLGVVTALGIAAFAVPSLVADADPALELAGRSSVVVHSGDTLWSIAESIAPEADPRAVVDALQEANDLTGAGLVPGQVLVLP
jgi:nucleoid-associated protein YgaU